MKNIKFAKSEIRQLKNIYQSTHDFFKFLESNKVLNNKTSKVLDAGCGYGSNIQFISKKYPSIEFHGWDYHKKKIDLAKKINKSKKNFFKRANLLKLKKMKNLDIDLVFSIHTFCCFKDIDKAISSISKIKSKWIVINSLFYDGPLDVLIHIRSKENFKNDENPDSDFNIHSVERTKKSLVKNGYKLYKLKKYYPKKKIKRKTKKRGSYTIKTEFDKNTTFSGPVHLPWHFLIAKRMN